MPSPSNGTRREAQEALEGSAERGLRFVAETARHLADGCVILFQDPATDRLTNHWITLHQDGVPAGFKPLLVMDVWEHAFMRDYKATDKAKYVEAFFRNIDWQMVERRLQEHAALRPAAAA